MFLADYIQDLRDATNNQLIYAEQVNLRSLHSVRQFATKWVDNSTPRRLDMVVLCAGTQSPKTPGLTEDGLVEDWQVTYLAHAHLLSILSPAIRAQPPDRDVRILVATCSSYLRGELDFGSLEKLTTDTTDSTSDKKEKKDKKDPKNKKDQKEKKKKPADLYATAKLALMIFAHNFQKHLTTAIKRGDESRPVNTRVLLVDPGYSRTPGMRRWLTGGSLWGLLLYLLTWPIWWLILKSPQQGAQSFLWAAMESPTALFSSRGPVEEGSATKKEEGGWLIKECRRMKFLREDVTDEAVGKKLWEFSEKQIEAKEKESALRRAKEKKKKKGEKEKKQK